MSLIDDRDVSEAFPITPRDEQIKRLREKDCDCLMNTTNEETENG